MLCSHQADCVSISRKIVRNNSLMASNITTLVEKAKQGDAEAAHYTKCIILR